LLSLLLSLLLSWWAVFAFGGPRIEWRKKILEEAARPRLCPPVLVLLIAEKLCLGGSGEGDFDRGYAGAFGYRQNSCRDKPAREPDFAEHADRPRP
jgi:hypothetical protein